MEVQCLQVNFFDARKYFSWDENDVYDNLQNTRTVMDGLKDRGWSIENILDDGSGTRDDWVYALSQADQFFEFNLKFTSDHNIGFGQPYLIVGTNKVAILGIRTGVQADYSEVFFNKVPEIPHNYHDMMTGNVVPFFIFDMTTLSF